MAQLPPAGGNSQLVAFIATFLSVSIAVALKILDDSIKVNHNIARDEHYVARDTVD